MKGKGQLSRAVFVFCALVLAVAVNATAAESATPVKPTGEEGAAPSYADYGAVLKAYVNDQGMVNYRELKAHPQDLDKFISALASTDPKAYEKWPDKDKIAFWLNTYNALTLKVIVDHYPIQTSFPESLLYPHNSVRQIKGAWTDIELSVMGKKVTLDGIEHETLRKHFNEPRIHMALVCAAMGCPPLRSEPYAGAALDRQLDDQAKRLLSNPQKFRIDRAGERVYVSPIFDWFGEDFVRTYGTVTKFQGRNEKERAVLNFISRYLTDEDRRYLESANYSIKYLDYDWSLNEQKPKEPARQS
jgi:hypothetical protein